MRMNTGNLTNYILGFTLEIIRVDILSKMMTTNFVTLCKPQVPRGACDKGHDRSIYLSVQSVSQLSQSVSQSVRGGMAKTDRAASSNRRGRDQREG